jgi:uncharacterized MAPEG superfamily protein
MEHHSINLTTKLFILTIVTAATVIMWVPYTPARIMTRGLMSTFGNPDPTLPPDPAWAERARRAHANAIENLAVFAPLVLIAAFVGVSTPATVFAAKLYLFARLLHYVVYAAGVPVLRTLAFIAGVVATLMYVVAILQHVA